MRCFGNGGNYWRNASVFNAENLASATVQNSNDDLLLNYWFHRNLWRFNNNYLLSFHCEVFLSLDSYTRPSKLFWNRSLLVGPPEMSRSWKIVCFSSSKFLTNRECYYWIDRRPFKLRIIFRIFTPLRYRCNIFVVIHFWSVFFLCLAYCNFNVLIPSITSITPVL